MAGTHYSHVVEPDYDPIALKQSAEITEYTKKISETIYKLWKNRKELQKELIAGKSIIEKPQHIYYDTDGISETQTQYFTVCHKCSGVSTIKSRNDRRESLFAITIPRDACTTCIDQGYKLYKDTTEGNHRKVYIQDQINNFYDSRSEE